MSKTLTNKVRLILVLALVMVVSVCASMFAFAKAEPTISSVDELTTFKMESTSIFYNEEDDKVGLNFTASISTAEYDAIQALGAETGLVIAPADYAPLTEENLFGDTAIYGWAEYVDGKWAPYAGDKIQVINIYTNDWVAGDGVYTYSGAIVDIKEQNVGTFFKAAAYVVDDEEVYAFTEEKETSTAIEVSKLGDDVPSYVPANWEAYETEVYDLGIVAPDFMGGPVIDLSDVGDAVVELVDVNGNKITEGLVDFSLPENQRVWTMNIYYDGVLVEVMNFDVVDENGLFVWNDEINLNSVSAITHESITEWDEEQGKNVVVGRDKLDYNKTGKGNPTEETIDGKDYISYTASGGNGTWFAWKPLHSKEYYEAWAGKGITLSASLIVDADGMVNPADQDGVLNQHSIFGVSGKVQIKATETFTGTTTLEDILANWDARVECNWDGQWNVTRIPAGMIYVYNVHNGGKIYVGDFSVNVPSDAYANKGGDILVNVEEAGDLTALDLTSYMEESHVAKLAVLDAAYDLSYSLKGYSIADEIEVTDLTAVDVSNAKRAAYDLVVSSGENTYYTARIDLYNTTDAVVWAESLTKDNVVLRRTDKFTIGAYYTENTQATFIDSDDFEIVDTITVGDKTHEGSFVKYTATEEMNLSVDIKALHSKAYYNEMIGDSTKVLHLRGFFSANSTMQVMCGMNNYGMNNVYTLGRQGFSGNKLESFVFSLNNMLIANSGDETYHGKFYDWNDVNGTNVGMCRAMVTFEVSSALIEKAPWDAYFGICGDQIVDGGETLVKATDIAGKVIDLSSETTYDLINLFPENQHAKFKAMAALWFGKDGKNFKGNAIGFTLTINGTKICVVPNENGEAILNLDDYIVAADGTVSDTVKVRDLLVEGNNVVAIRCDAPSATNATDSWPVYVIAPAYGNPAVTTTITIVGPAVEAAE